MDTPTIEVPVKRQVKFTFTGLVASVYVNGSDKKLGFDITPLSDDIKLELIQYGFKQKLSDYRANDKLVGIEKVAAIAECYEMLKSGNFRQTRKSGVWLTEEVISEWQEMSDTDKAMVRKFAPERAAKLDAI